MVIPEAGVPPAHQRGEDRRRRTGQLQERERSPELPEQVLRSRPPELQFRGRESNSACSSSTRQEPGLMLPIRQELELPEQEPTELEVPEQEPTEQEPTEQPGRTLAQVLLASRRAASQRLLPASEQLERELRSVAVEVWQGDERSVAGPEASTTRRSLVGWPEPASSRRHGNSRGRPVRAASVVAASWRKPEQRSSLPRPVPRRPTHRSAREPGPLALLCAGRDLLELRRCSTSDS